MKVDSLKFGFSCSAGLLNDEYRAREIFSLINSFVGDGNVFYAHYHSGRTLQRAVAPLLANLGKHCGDRLLEKELSAYTEEKHLDHLKELGQPVFFISRDMDSDVGKTPVEVLKFGSIDYKKRLPFFRKQEPFEIPQDKLVQALVRTVGKQKACIDIRDPYLNRLFVNEVIHQNILSNAQIKFRFSLTDEDLWARAGLKWVLGSHISEAHKWSPFPSKKHKQDYIRKNLGKFAKNHVQNIFSDQTLEAQQKVLKANREKKLQFLFYRLKDDHFDPYRYDSDCKAHWHHRYLQVEQNNNTYTFESSHSFIHKIVRDTWRDGGESLHFRAAKNEEFKSFEEAFEVPVDILYEPVCAAV